MIAQSNGRNLNGLTSINEGTEGMKVEKHSFGTYASVMSKLFAFLLLAILTSPATAKEFVQRELNAARAVESIKVDGKLNEVIWENAEIATGFTQNDPVPGAAPSQKTEVRIVYDDDALYVGAMMYDTSPDSILSQLTNRDNLGNTDFFGMWISCFRDGINAFQFIVTPDGVQYDAQISAFGEDQNWNAVWQCNTSRNEQGWVAEFKIPYSAIRFPEQAEQRWDVNFSRSIRRLRELSYWQPVDPNIPGVVNQSGTLQNITDITPPVRLFFYPYLVGYGETVNDPNNGVQSGARINGGMDLKFGLTDAFTLDMALIPDFGNVRSDNKVLNLSPFEVFFEEQRQFFTEGTELFSKGDLFYSRRIGGFPINYGNAFDNLQDGEEVVSNPTEPQLLNASKISGRTPKGLGLGFFNAVTARSIAEIQDSLGNIREVETAPLTNYNVLVADQNLGNNSYITIINTNVMRAGDTYDANVTGTEFDLRNKKNSFQFVGGGAFSRKFSAESSDEDEGYRYDMGVAKIDGQFNFGLDHSVSSKHFDSNDLGFLRFSNFTSTGAWMNYNIFEPFGPFNSLWSNVYINYDHLHEPNRFMTTSMWGNVGLNTRNFDSFNIEASYEPVGSYDFFEPRVDGWFFKRPENFFVGGWISSDYRRRVALDIGTWNTWVPNTSWHVNNYRISPRFRVNDKFMLVYVYSRQNTYNELGFTNIADDGRIIFGKRDVITHTNLLTANYIFTNRMGLTLRVRHYWRTVGYENFQELGRDGLLHGDIQAWNLETEEPEGFLENGTTRDLSYNAWNIDMIYTWVFSPGSELRIVWQNSIEDANEVIPSTFDNNLDYLFDQTVNNSISVRLLYFIDYLNFVRKDKFIEN